MALIQAMSDDAVKFTDGAVFVIKDGKGFDPVSGAEVPVPEAAEDVINNNQMRGELDAALASIMLFSADAKVRAEAVKTLLAEPDEAKLSLIEKAYAAEVQPAIKDALNALRSAMLLGSADKAKRLDAAKALGLSGTPATKTLLDRRKVEPEADVKAAIGVALSAIEGRLAWGERLGVIFTGISLGSILLLVAPGLAITYGLMGVINMACGELMMIGAYATYVIQTLFRAYVPGLFDYYVLLAIPASFLAAALVGAVLERSVIRWLYGRPLETLMATWGISLVLQQGVRSIFGAQDVPVENPAWLSGGVAAMSNLTLPYNRIVIVAFAVLVLAGVSAPQVPEAPVFEQLSVFENLELALKADRGGRSSMFFRLSGEQLDRIGAMLTLIHLKDSAQRVAGLLSHGQKQWLEIGMLLMQDPKLLLLDEPVAGMTDEETERTAELFLSLEGNHSLVVVEHDMKFIGELTQDGRNGKKVTVLHEGSVLAEGLLSEVQANEKVVEVYLGR